MVGDSDSDGDGCDAGAGTRGSMLVGMLTRMSQSASLTIIDRLQLVAVAQMSGQLTEHKTTRG